MDTPNSIQKVWAIQMEMAQKLVEVCKRHDLKVFMNSGTLLGAVRHKGFIPWDDDIDMVMLREDYDKLVRLTDEFESPYFLQSYLSEPGYARGHAQLRRSDTTAILPGDIWLPYNQGIFIDIFVYDDIPDSEEQYREIEAEIHRRFAHMRHRIYDSFLSFSVRHMWRMVKLFAEFEKKSFKEEFHNAERLLTDLPKGKKGLITNAMLAPNRKYGRKREWFDEMVMLPFEDIELPAPRGYHEELSLTFGKNYMTPVKSPSLHGTVIFDTERPYREVLKELRSQRPLKERMIGKFMLPLRRK